MRPDEPGGVDDGGPALFRLVRFWSRRWSSQAAEELTGQARHVQHILTVEAVDGVAEADVGTIAHRLGLDHSGASRMTRDAVAAGYLVRSAAERDRRHASLRLTAEGRALLEGARRWQRRTFAELTAGWDEADRERFSAYLRRLADEQGA